MMLTILVVTVFCLFILGFLLALIYLDHKFTRRDYERSKTD